MQKFQALSTVLGQPGLTSHICVGCQEQVSASEAQTMAGQESDAQMDPDLQEAEDKERGAGADDGRDAGIGAHCGEEDLHQARLRPGAST